MVVTKAMGLEHYTGVVAANLNLHAFLDFSILVERGVQDPDPQNACYELCANVNEWCQSVNV